MGQESEYLFRKGSPQRKEVEKTTKIPKILRQKALLLMFIHSFLQEPNETITGYKHYDKGPG